MIKFGFQVSTTFVLHVCEELLAVSNPKEKDAIVFGGVHLRISIISHWAGFERYMLIGQGWTCGFNLREPGPDCDPENIFKAFGSQVEVFTPSMTGERAFVRDMTVLAMTASDWEET